MGFLLMGSRLDELTVCVLARVRACMLACLLARVARLLAWLACSLD